MSTAVEASFAVLRFVQNEPLVEGCIDPIISPGRRSAHAHTVMGASNFGTTVSGPSLTASECTNAQIPGDNSAYWMPKLYFQDPSTGLFEDVSLYYANVYYFFDHDDTDDEIVPFPLGMQMISGDALLRSAPAAGGDLILDPEDAPDGKAQPAQWTCPRSSNDPPTYPVDSDGSTAGIKNSSPSAKDFGTGFPTVQCDGLYSPLRADLHFPSCYNPEAGLEDWQNSMAWPSRKYEKNGNGKKNCPPGYLHVPHLFFEYYWDTQAFSDRWTPDGQNQPFVLANGDRTGFSLHGDFISGWDEEKLSWIINNCDAGTIGMDKCFSDLDVSSLPKCSIESTVKDILTGTLDALPCGNSLSGWGVNEDSTPVTDTETETKTEEETASETPAIEEATVQSNSNAQVPETENPATEETDLEEEEELLSEESKPEAETPKITPQPVSEQSYDSYSGNYGEVDATTASVNVAEAPAPTPAPETLKASEKEEGDSNIVTVWVTETVTHSTTVQPSAQPTAASSANAAGIFSYAGCYLDSEERVLVNPGPHGGMTPEICIESCSTAGFSLAGVEYGGECFCGDSLKESEQIDDSKCNMACEGDASQTCGGSWALAVYSNDGTVAMEKRHLIRKSRIHRHGLHKRWGFSHHH